MQASSIRSSPDMVPALVGFFFAFRAMTVLVSVRAFGLDSDVGAATNIGLDFLLLGVVAFCTLGDRLPTRSSVAQYAPVRWALSFLGFSLCSLLWSSSASLPDSCLYWCAMAADFLMVYLLLQARSLECPVEDLMQGYVWGACLVAWIAWILPAQSDLRLGDEELLGPNQVGFVCAVGFFFAQYLLREAKGASVLSAVLLAVTLLRSLSKTTIVAFVAGQGLLLLRDRSMSRKAKIFALLAAIMIVAVFSSLLSSYYEVYTNAGNQSETLTGRLGIWAYFLAEAVQQPWIGHGFDSAWRVIPPFGADQFQAAHAHNELLQQFYAYGAVGIVLFCGIYGSFFLQVRRLSDARQRTFSMAYLVFVLVRGFADTERFDLSLPMWAVLMFVWQTAPEHVMRSRSLTIGPGWKGVAENRVEQA